MNDSENIALDSVKQDTKSKNPVGRPRAEYKKGRIYAVRLDSRLENQFNAYLLTHGLKPSLALRKAIINLISEDLG